MSSPYNNGRYNLTGFNATPIGAIYATATITERFGFIPVSTVNNVYPLARLYENIGVQWLEVLSGRFAKGSSTDTITKTKAEMIGCFWRQAETDDTFNAEAAGELPFWRKISSTDVISMSGTAIGAYWKTAGTEIEIDCVKAAVTGCCWRKAVSNDEFGAALGISNVTFAEAQTADTFTGLAYLSEIVFQTATGESTIGGQLIFSSYVFTAGETFDLIDAHCDVLSQEILTCILTCSLAPGQTMVIDAGTYNVWIDGENAVNKHSGDWLDELNRNTQNITINAASGRNYLSATILYTERYL